MVYCFQKNSELHKMLLISKDVSLDVITCFMEIAINDDGGFSQLSMSAHSSFPQHQLLQEISNKRDVVSVGALAYDRTDQNAAPQAWERGAEDLVQK